MNVKLYDISLKLDARLAGWPGDAPFAFRWTCRLADGDSVNLGEVATSVHAGTHADAPLHFDADGAAISDVPLEAYVGPARVVDVGGADPIRVADLERHDLARTPRLLLRTSAWQDRTVFPAHIPVMAADVPEWLAGQGVVLIGLDVPSVDALDSKDLPNHHALSRRGIAILESLDLDAVPEGAYELIALPLRLASADGSPVRAVLRERKLGSSIGTAEERTMKIVIGMAVAAALALGAVGASAQGEGQVRTSDGVLEGVTDSATGVRSFKGIPFAAPPVGSLRWREPQPVKPWRGVRRADKFGPRAMQPPIFGDMVFRSDGMSEDCLYLNVWTPAKSGRERLPVLVYFYGGGFVAGDGSEPRYDGASMAQRGIVAVTVNYRLGVFGFLAHPELTKESPHHASGNFGLLDQNAALRWVHRNIAAFGGDPKRVTIAGESAGSMSVSAQMVSPLSKGLIAGAIGESGALIAPALPPVPLSEGEAAGVKFAEQCGAHSLAELRAFSSQQVLDASTRGGPFRFSSTVDGYFLPKLPVHILAAGEQAHVPLLVGWNSQEGSYQGVLGRNEPTVANYDAALRRLYGDRAEEALRVYSASTPEQVIEAATALASDRFIGYCTWKWFDLHNRTGGKPVYRYFYTHPRPGSAPPHGAVHSAEIEYALGNLATNRVFAWTPEDYKVSATLEGYFANFIKTGDPNGEGLPHWPAAGRGAAAPERMRVDVDSHAEPARHDDRYRFLDTIYSPGH